MEVFGKVMLQMLVVYGVGGYVPLYRSSHCLLMPVKLSDGNLEKGTKKNNLAE